MISMADRDSLRKWEEFRDDMYRDSPVELNMTRAQMEKHRAYLEAHPIEWILFFFEKTAKYEFADFQKEAILRCIKNDEWYEVLSWSRELAKSTIVMFIVMYLVLTGRKRNVILASATEIAAGRLLAPYKKAFEKNGRIRAYYGQQVNLGSWKENHFVTKGGASFMGIGAGNAPRGSRNDDLRVDVLLMDDFDTDEAIRNPETIKKNWDWFEGALYFTRSMSEPLLVIWCGNIIAKDCCVVRAGKKARELSLLEVPEGHWDIINLKMVNIRKPDPKNDMLYGTSVWPSKNTPEFLRKVLSKISKSAVQRECYNNPVVEGTVFTNLPDGKVPPLKKFKYLVIYGDPAPGESKKKGACFKAVWLIGMLDGKLYVIKGFLDHALNSTFIEWYVKLLEYVGGKTNVYCFMENNKLQDPFFQQVFKPMIKKIKRNRGIDLAIQADEERKTDKATRIDSNLEPLDSAGDLIFNEEEKDNPHMIELKDQFQLFELHLPYAIDGPDCIEGGKRVLEKKIQAMIAGITVMSRAAQSRKNRHRM